jgi:hypothetical protein
VKQVGLVFPSFASKLVEEQRWVVYVASSRRSRGSEAKDDRFDDIECSAMEVGSNYPSLDVIFVLAHRGILVFCCGLVIWPTKSPRRFFGLVLKTKWEEVCQFAPQNQ